MSDYKGIFSADVVASCIDESMITSGNRNTKSLQLHYMLGTA